jgi:hypothetical protein
MVTEIQNLIINGDNLNIWEVRSYAQKPEEGYLPMHPSDTINTYSYEYDVHMGMSSDHVTVSIDLQCHNEGEEGEEPRYDTAIRVHNNDWATLSFQAEAVAYAVQAFEKIHAHVHGVEI